jgi:FixJ family two-component response regulator
MSALSDATVFLVDDDEAVRDALSMMLRAAGLAVESFESAYTFLERETACRLGCLVLDVRMPEMSGLELQERLVQQRCTLPIIFLTGHGDVPMAVRAVKRGAFDFIQKPVDDRRLLATVESALGFCVERSGELSNGRPLPPAVATLSRREREVLDLILAGRQTRAIADELYISVKTVEFHRARIHEKLGVASMAELFSLCFGGGLVRPASP